MGFWDFIKENKIDLNSIIGDLSKGVDALAFTPEERAEFNIKLADKLAAYVEGTMNENSIRSKTRRMISFIIIGAFLILVFLAVVLSIFAPENAQFVTELSSNSVMTTAFIMVLAFFFGGYYMEKLPKIK